MANNHSGAIDKQSGELNYSYSRKNSEDMLMVLKTFVKHHSEYQGEALLEFLHAIAIGKLRLFKKHYPPLIDDLDCIVNEYVSTLKNKIEEIYKSTI